MHPSTVISAPRHLGTILPDVGTSARRHISMPAQLLLSLLCLLFLHCGEGIHDFGITDKGTGTGELKVLVTSPKGDGIAIATEGVTVMFDSAMVPLTTIDKMRDLAVPLAITPATPGKFFWLGTKGFIFRPEAPWIPATRYKVSLQKGLSSLDGRKLAADLTWEFATVTPKVRDTRPDVGDMLLPKKAAVTLTFNMAMHRDEVMKNLAVTAGSGAIAPANIIPSWFSGDRELKLAFAKELPWHTDITVSLPAGTRAAKGELGMKEAFARTYKTPAGEALLEKVSWAVDVEEHRLNNATENVIPALTGICYRFSAPVTTASFKRAVAVDSDGVLPVPHFYFRDYEPFYTGAEDYPAMYIEGYFTACVAFLDQHNTLYHLSLEHARVETVSGAPLMGEGQRFAVRTPHAEPHITSNLTKTIISARGFQQIPYHAVNVGKMSFAVFRLNGAEDYAESVKDANLKTFRQRYDASTHIYVNEEPLVSEDLGKNLPVYVTADLTIDQERWTPIATREMDLATKPDESARFVMDLAGINNGKNLAPGVYLIEALGSALVPDAKDPDGAYSIIQITPLALALKREPDHLLVWATDIESGNPAPGVPVRAVFNRDDAESTEVTGITDADGVALFTGAFTAKEYDYSEDACVEVTDPARFSTTCQKLHELNSWRTPLRNNKNYYAWGYTDRPIYRPGQTVHYSAFIREVFEGRYFIAANDLKVNVSVRDASYADILSRPGVIPENGGVVSGSFDLPAGDDAPRGEYAIRFALGEQNFSRSFYVQSYRKPSFKVELTAQSPEIISGDTLQARVKGTYFFGAPLAKGDASWSIMTTTHVFSPAGYTDYSFIDDDLLHRHDGDDGDYYGDTEYDTVASWPVSEEDSHHVNPRGKGSTRSAGAIFTEPSDNDVRRRPGALDAKGELAITYRAELAKYPVSQLLTVEGSVTDPAGQEVSAADEVIVHRAAHYLGLKSDKWAYGENETANFTVVSLDTQGKPIGGKTFTAKFVRRDYKYIQRRNTQGFWEFLYEHEDVPVGSATGVTDTAGKTSLPFKIERGGTYRVSLTSEDTRGNPVQTATQVYAWGEGYVPWKLNEVADLELVPDKTEYKIGETARILVKTLIPVTKALVSFERGRVLDYRVMDLGGNATHIEIPVTQGMIPNFHVSVTAHAGRGADHPPLVYHGETELAVNTESKRLGIALTPDRPAEGEYPASYAPGDNVTVNIKTSDPVGQPQKAHVIVSVADESVLQLLDYQLPDLVRDFYFRRPNQVLSSSSMRSLKSGDGGEGKKRRQFRDTAHFIAHLETGDNGEGSFTFALPDDLTTWVIEAVAISDSKTADAFDAEARVMSASQNAPSASNYLPGAPASASLPGSAGASLAASLNLTDGTFVGASRAKVMTTLPVLVRPALPRFVAWDDRVEARVVLTNRTATALSGNLNLKLGDLAEFADGPAKGEQSLAIAYTVAPRAEKALPFTFKVARLGGDLPITATAMSSLGNTYDAVEITLPVLDRYAPEVTATSGTVTDATMKEQLAIPENARDDRGGIETSFKASLSLALAAPLRQLIYFPWGCSEQKSAALIALTLAHDLSTRFGEKYLTLVAPLTDKELALAPTYAARMHLLQKKIGDISVELTRDFQSFNGGIRYWQDSTRPDFMASVQTAWALTLARDVAGTAVSASALDRLGRFIMAELGSGKLSDDYLAYGLWGLSLLGRDNPQLAETLVGKAGGLKPAELAYLSMAEARYRQANVPFQGAQILTGAKGRLMDALIAKAKHADRHVSWPAETSSWWNAPVRNSALAGLAILNQDPQNPLLPKTLTFLLHRRSTRGDFISTQDTLYLVAFAYEYGRAFSEAKTNYTATLTANGNEVFTKVFSQDNVLEKFTAAFPVVEVLDWGNPVDLGFNKKGTGTLYYDMSFKYYLLSEASPPREEGIIITRDYYATTDATEKNPLAEFKEGETYKGHITLVIAKDLNYVIIEEKLPAGFEPVDMTLATTGRAAQSLIEDGELEDDGYSYRETFDDEVSRQDYGADYGFSHQEIRDDAVVFFDTFLPAGVYHVRYPVRASIPGTYLAPGATAFEFYEPEVFGRTRPRTVTVKRKP